MIGNSHARRVWLNGIQPLISTPGLRALERALLMDDPGLIQGATTSPPPLQCVEEWECEAACAIGYAGWKGDGLGTVRDVEEYFARLCFAADNKLGESGAVRHFINWADDTPRSEMRRQLLNVVQEELAARIPNLGKVDGL